MAAVDAMGEVDEMPSSEENFKDNVAVNGDRSDEEHIEETAVKSKALADVVDNPKTPEPMETEDSEATQSSAKETEVNSVLEAYEDGSNHSKEPMEVDEDSKHDIEENSEGVISRDEVDKPELEIENGSCDSQEQETEEVSSQEDKTENDNSRANSALSNNTDEIKEVETQDPLAEVKAEEAESDKQNDDTIVLNDLGEHDTDVVIIDGKENSSSDANQNRKHKIVESDEVIDLDSPIKKKKKVVELSELPPRRSSRNLNKQRKSYVEEDEEEDKLEEKKSEKESGESDIEEVLPEDPLAVADPLHNEIKGNSTKCRSSPTSTIVVKDTKRLVEIASQPNSTNLGKKEPTLVIIDTNSILSGRGPIPIAQKTTSSNPTINPTPYPMLPMAVPAQGVYPANMRATITPIPISTSTSTPKPTQSPLPSLLSTVPSPSVLPSVVLPSVPNSVHVSTGSVHVTPGSVHVSAVHPVHPPPLVQAPPQSPVQQQPPPLLPTLTDDMFVVEAPSFIVPYVYEKPPVKELKQYIKDMEKEAEEKKKKEEEEEKRKKEEEEKRKEEEEEKRKKEEEEEKKKKNEEEMKEEVKGESEKEEERKKMEEEDGESKKKEAEVEKMDVDKEGGDKEKDIAEKDKETAEKDLKEKDKKEEESKKGDSAKTKEPEQKEKDQEKMDKKETVNEVGDNAQDLKDEPKKIKTYFDTPLGSFFVDLGFNLVQEYVQNDLLKQQKRKRDREQGQNAQTNKTIASLIKNLEFSRENNEPFRMELKKCQFCSFKTESALAMAFHLETPHMKNYVYRCNFCPFEIRSPHDILFHMEAEHGVRGRLERAPAFHQCPNCPFEDNQKGKLSRHLVTCQRRFRPERNLEPPVDWDPPAKIPRAPRMKQTGLNATAAMYQAMTQQRAPNPFHLMQKLVHQQQQPGIQMVQRGRGRPSLGAIKPPQNLKTTGGMVYKQMSGGSVFVPTSYQLTGNQVFQVVGGQEMGGRLAPVGSTAFVPNLSSTPSSVTIQQQAQQSQVSKPKPVQQPSISITPLPRGTTANTTLIKPGDSNSKNSFVICEICDGYIKDLEQLRNHMQWIHKVKIHPKMIYNRPPLNCQKCQFRFFTDQGLERHLLGSHGLVTSSMQEAANKSKDAGRCPVCGRVYQWKLLNHVARDHNMTLKPAHLSYKCTVCTATFGMYKQFENHVYSAHSVVAKRVMDKKSSLPNNASGASKNDTLLKPLKINDEITIIPQPAKSSNKEGSPCGARGGDGASTSKNLSESGLSLLSRAERLVRQKTASSQAHSGD